MKMRWRLGLALWLSAGSAFAGDHAAEELLRRTIAFHDPSGRWMQSTFQFDIKSTYADGRARVRKSRVNFATGAYEQNQEVEGRRVRMAVTNGNCAIEVDGQRDVPPDFAQKHRLSCERAKLFRNYISYLWGLPMKLKDPGTRLDPKVETGTFRGEKVRVLTVRYEPSTGTDVWRFYIRERTAEMIGYAFEKADGKGEYIVLEGIQVLSNGARIPRVRKWYETKGDVFLGSDVLLSADVLAQRSK